MLLTTELALQPQERELLAWVLKEVQFHLIFTGNKNPVSGNESRVGRGAGWEKKRFFKGLQEIFSREESRKVTKSLRDRT